MTNEAPGVATEAVPTPDVVTPPKSLEDRVGAVEVGVAEMRGELRGMHGSVDRLVEVLTGDRKADAALARGEVAIREKCMQVTTALIGATRDVLISKTGALVGVAAIVLSGAVLVVAVPVGTSIKATTRGVTISSDTTNEQLSGGNRNTGDNPPLGVSFPDDNLPG